MRTVIRELGMQTDFTFFDFVFNVVKRFYSFENELIECFSKVFDPSFIINQYNELGGDSQVDKLTIYEESVLKQYNLIKDK